MEKWYELTMDLNQALKGCFLFSGLSEAELCQVQAIAVSKRYAKGQLIFTEGREATGFYVVVSGKVKLYKISPEGKEQILHLVSPGETFAEAVMFSGGRYPATAEAIGDCELIYFPKGSFLQLIKQNPQLSLNMLATMAQLLRRFNRLVEKLSLRDVASRLAQYLVERAYQSGRQTEAGVELELDTSKGQLAAKLGTVSETLSRTLRKFREARIVRVEGNKITVLDLPSLKEVATGLKNE
jgi:CRP/FNR family transcriptional regulator